MLLIVATLPYFVIRNLKAPVGRLPGHLPVEVCSSRARIYPLVLAVEKGLTRVNALHVNGRALMRGAV